MSRIRLIHWHADEAEERADRLRALGHEVDASVPAGGGLIGPLGDDPPDAVVIDLGRLPVQGRDVGIALRRARATRTIPLVFVDGSEEKVADARRVLPDATYAGWAGVEGAVEAAIAAPPEDPVVPDSALAGYSRTPLARKLGIRPDAVVALVDPPPGFEETVGEIPEGARLVEDPDHPADLTIWFVRSLAALEAGVGSLDVRVERGPVWIAWPKKASGVESDVTQPAVREAGLGTGLVDYKICAIDETWSALLFTRRKA